MKRIDINEILIGIIESGKEFEQFTELEKMAMGLKGALEYFKNAETEEDKAFFGAMIGTFSKDLKAQGVII
mgnify:CR=1 FL=1